MPSAEKWEAKLRGAVDPSGAVSDFGVLKEQLRLVLGNYFDGFENLSSRLRADGERLIDVISEEAPLGALDDLFLGKEELEAVASQLNARAFMEGGASVQYEREGGGVLPLLERLVDYVRDHPFIT
jgi:hypothetical protein